MALSELAAAVPVDIMPGAGDPANYTLPQQPLHRCLFPGAAAYSSLLRATNPHDFDVDGVTFLGTSGQNVDDVYRWAGLSESARGPGWKDGRVWCCLGVVGEVCRSSADGPQPPAADPSAFLPALCHITPLPLAPPTPRRYSDIEDRAAILGKLLQWRHLAPTAPDTLAAYPYFESDPFILESSPHVLFAGGQPAFATGVAEVEGGSVRLVAVPNFCTTGCVVLVNLSTLACQPIYFEDAMQA